MRRASLDLLFGAALLLGVVSPAHGAQRAFVASNGVDAGNLVCALATPCRSFQQAINNVDPGGEVVVLDSAGYGSMTIGKSVAVIVPTGLHAGLTIFAGSGVTISAPGKVVTLRGLYLNGLGGATGINVNDAAEVHVENCVIAGFSSLGINLSASGTRMWVLDTIVRDNGNTGILINNQGLAQRATVVVDRARLENNGTGGAGIDGGLHAVSGADVTISNSVMSGNFRGVAACGLVGDAANAVIVVEKSVTTFNGVGLFVGSNGATNCVMLSSDTNITRNSIFGIEQQAGSVVTSYGGNTVFNNAGNTFGLTVPKS
jgi:Right handed beta helix region